jgi:hypothetical protein
MKVQRHRRARQTWRRRDLGGAVKLLVGHRCRTGTAKNSPIDL